MKRLLFFSACAFALAITGCKKEAVPDNNQKYVGTWEQEDSTSADTHNMVINADGSAEYHSVEIDGAATKTFDVTGNIWFEGYDFKIGGKVFHKKFKANQPPKRVITSMKPYTYYEVATFNGVDYRKKKS